MINCCVALLAMAMGAAAPASAMSVDPNGMPPAAAAVMRRVLRDNTAFVAQHQPHYFDSFRDGQKPDLTLLACSDARFQEGDLDQSPDGQVFSVRNIGNQVDLNEGSIEYGIRHLHTPVLLIVGHVSCGAVRAALDDYAQESSALRRELNGLHLSLRRTKESEPLAKRWLAGVEANVHQQVRDALQAFKPEVDRKELTIVGAVYDFRNDLKLGTGRLVIINTNGVIVAPRAKP